MACFVLAFAGHAKEAAPLGERALTLSPKCPGSFLGTVGNAYRLAGRMKEAIAAFKACHEIALGLGLVDLVLVYEEVGRREKALESAKLLLEVRPYFTIKTWQSTQFQADMHRLQRDVELLLAAGLPMDQRE